MTDIRETPGAIAVVRRLRDAISEHDLDALADCFAPDFRSELPTFPDASFTGNENVRRNWDRILSAVPDITAEIVRWTGDADTAWVEWQQQGTQRNGRPHLARGIIFFTVAGDRITFNRFYVHPVRSGPPDVLDG